VWASFLHSLALGIFDKEDFFKSFYLTPWYLLPLIILLLQLNSLTMDKAVSFSLIDCHKRFVKNYMKSSKVMEKGALRRNSSFGTFTQ
jgi:hypothetical protein